MHHHTSYSFKNDYSEGCHPAILEKLIATNFEQQDGYGEDKYSLEAKELLRQRLENPDAEVVFVSGGTQANIIAIASILKPFETVITVHSAHINTHEAAAIESSGHRIETVDGIDGKLTPQGVEEALSRFQDFHNAKPRLVYISNSTELGTIYRKAELEQLSRVCKANGLYLYLDGARLGSALCSKQNDIRLAELSQLVDIFYIGATKNGGLLGEAIIINNPRLKEDFLFHVKQRGGLLAKGRLLGVQFLTLFQDNLFFELAEHANQMATKLAQAIQKQKFTFLTEPATNQIFPILPNRFIERFSSKYDFYIWQRFNNETSVIRLVTSWATDVQMIERFIADLNG